MKLLSNVALVAAFLAFALPACPATLSGAGARDTILEQDALDFLTIGADYQQQERDISGSSLGKMRLKSQTVDGFVGVDPYEWLLIFATAGGSAAEVTDSSSYNNAKFKWSAGFNLNLWHFDIQEPTFLEGRLSLRTHLEFAMHNSGADKQEINWNEVFASLLVNYEVFAATIDKLDKYPYSLMLYVGPALSWLNGHYYDTGASSQKVDFHEEQTVGVVGGVELYAAYNLSVGAAVQYYDQASVSASVRYHF